MELHEKYKSLFAKYGVNTKLRLANFLGQVQHESNFKPISENLNYQVSGLLKTFPKYFGVGNVHEYAKQPQKIANRVYANRMGNGNENSGEGWKFRGRGFIQITGKENYFRLSNDTDIDFIHNPDLLLEEANSVISALWFWNLKGLNVLADKDDVKGITKRINGGLNGLDDRIEKVNNWKNKLT
jgi:putative chitinase